MKKTNINEDIMISDPALAQQYANGKQQLVNKDSLINGLNKQILTLQQDKIKIQQALDQIEKKSADTIQKPTATTDQQTQPANKELDNAQRALASQILMNKPTTESLYVNNLKSKLDTLKENLRSVYRLGEKFQDPKFNELKLEIDIINSELANLNEEIDNPFSSQNFYDISNPYVDSED